MLQREKLKHFEGYPYQKTPFQFFRSFFSIPNTFRGSESKRITKALRLLTLRNRIVSILGPLLLKLV